MIAGLPITHAVTIDELKMEIDVAMKLSVLAWQRTLGSVTRTDRRIAAGWVGIQQAILEDPLVWEANGANPFTIRSEGHQDDSHALSVLKGEVVCITSYVNNAQHSLSNDQTDMVNHEHIFVFVDGTLIAVQDLYEWSSGNYFRKIAISDRINGGFPGWKRVYGEVFQHETGEVFEYIKSEQEGNERIHR